MAWAEQQRSGRWAPRYRDAAGDTKGLDGKTFTSEAAAKRAAAVEEDKARRQPGDVDPKAAKMTWGTWWPQWWAQRDVEPSTAREDLSRLRLHVEPRWGHVPLGAIRRQDIQAWVDDLGDEDSADLGAESVRHCHNLLSGSLRAAVVAEKLQVSPCHDIRLPTPPEPDERFLTHDEVNAICEVLNGKYRTLVLLLVGTGLRWGEAAGLHWHRVDLDEGWIDVREVFDDKSGEVKPYAKGGPVRQRRLRRRVWLPDWLVDELRTHRELHPHGPECSATHRRDSRCRSSLVIPNSGGGALSYSRFRTNHWARAVGRHVYVVPGDPKQRVFDHPSAARRVAVGRDTEPKQVWQPGMAVRIVSGQPVPVTDATIHDCRHTFASWSLQADPPMPLYDLAVAMGHTDSSITRRYGHLANSSRERFRRALAWPGAAPPVVDVDLRVAGDS